MSTTAPPRRGRGGDAARAVVGVLLPRVWRVRVTGLEHLPASGPVLLAANHTGLLDGPLVWGSVPRDVRFLVKDEMFTGVLGALLRATRQVPVDRSGGGRALVAAAAVLAGGGVVGLFPEGTRGAGDVAELRSGVAWLALRSGAPVVPVAVHGTRPGSRSPLGPLPAPRTALHVALAPPVQLLDGGPPVAGDGQRTRRESVAAAAERLRRVMAAHVAATAPSTAPPATPPPAPAPPAAGPGTPAPSAAPDAPAPRLHRGDPR